MGKEVEKAAIEKGHIIAAHIDNEEDWIKHQALLDKADVVFDFSLPATVVANIRRCFDHHIPVVCGTTGWNADEPLVRKWCSEEGQAIFAASNFSIGMNIMFRLAGQLGSIIDRFDEYDITLEEIHHIHKLDAPSGTAIRLADIFLKEVKRKKKWVNRIAKSDEELQVISVREGEIPGIHTIVSESGNERIVLRHEAKSRKGLAAGALLAAEWLMGKKGYYEMNDLIQVS